MTRQVAGLFLPEVIEPFVIFPQKGIVIKIRLADIKSRGEFKESRYAVFKALACNQSITVSRKFGKLMPDIQLIVKQHRNFGRIRKYEIYNFVNPGVIADDMTYFMSNDKL